MTKESMNLNPAMTRRSFLAATAGLTAWLLLPDTESFAKITPKPLRLYSPHTNEKIVIPYAPGKYKGSLKEEIDYFLRDFRTGDEHHFDARLFDTLCAIQHCCSGKTSFEVLSGYRSPRTNAILRKKSSGVAKKSLHMQGKALDIRVPGISTRKLRDMALRLHNGGVGYYPKSGFVHIDTGKKRTW